MNQPNIGDYTQQGISIGSLLKVKKQLLCTTALAGLAFFVAHPARAACDNNAPITGDPAITCTGTDNTGIAGAGADGISVTVQSGADITTAVTGIELNDDATIVVDGGGTITSTVNSGIIVGDGADITINGAISGANNAIELDGGSVTIGATGNVNGNNVGVLLNNNVNATLDVAGTLIGGAGAATFGAGNAIFILRTGATVTGAVTASGGADEFHFNTSGASAFDSDLIGTQYLGFDTLHKDGAGTLTLGGTTLGDWNVNVGTLVGTVDNLNNVDIDAGALLRFSGGGVHAGDITGAGGVEKNGGAALELTGSNTFTGSLTVDSATLTVQDAAAFSGTSGVSLNAATFEFDSAFTTDRNFDIGAGDATFDTQAFTNTISGDIGGTGALIKNGAGTLLLTGMGTYDGITVNAGTLTGNSDNLVGNATINGGTLSFNQGVDGTYAGDITGAGILNKTGAGNLTLSGTTTHSGGTNIAQGLLTGDTSSLQGTITMAGGNLAFDQAGTGNFTGQIAGAGNLTITGGGTVVFTAQNTYSGQTSIEGGATLGVNASNRLGDGTGGNSLYLHDGTLRFDGSFTTGRSVLLDIGHGTFDTNGNDGTLTGTITGGGGLIKEGAGTLTLNNAANAYNGDTTINAGTLLVQNSGSLGNATNNIIFNGGEFEYGAAFDHGRDIDIQAGGATFDTSIFSSTLTGEITGTGTLTKSGGGTLTLNHDNSAFSGNIIFDEGTLSVNANNRLGAGTNTLVFDGGTLQQTTAFDNTRNVTLNAGGGTINSDADTEFSGDFAGAGALTKTGTGRLTLSGTNNYSGGTTVSAGALEGTTTSLQGDILNNATLTFNQNTDGTYAGDLTGNGVVEKLDTGILTLTGNNSAFGGDYQIEDGTISIAASSNLSDGNGSITMEDAGLDFTGSTTLANDIIFTGAAATFDSNANTVTLSGDISGTSDFVKSGTGTLALTGANTYIGTLLVNEGAVRISADTGFGNAANTVDIGDAALQYGASFDHARDIALSDANSAIDTNGFNSTLTGTISGAGGLTKTGLGTLTLNGTSSWSGGTTVSGGTLAGNTDTLLGDITNNATVLFDQAGPGTYAGDMSGTGVASFDGGGIYTLTGANTYTGGTNVAALTTIRGAIGAIQGDIVNDGDVVIVQGVGGAFTDDISGTGALTVDAGGQTITLSGTNTYTGGTTVTATTTVEGDTDSITGDYANAGTVIFDQALGGTYSGDMSGAGALVKNGAATLTIDGTHTYTGDTQINAGSLALDTGASLAAASDIFIDDDAALAFLDAFTLGNDITLTGTGGIVDTGAFNVTLSGVVDGTRLTKDGAGTLTLSGLNTYTDLLVNAGILQGTTDSIVGTIVNDATVAFDQAGAGTYAGDISGTGDVTFDGGGDFTLTGTNTYTGGTDILAATSVTGDTDALQGDIDIAGALVFDMAGAGTYADQLTGAGTLEIDGGGNINFTGDNSGFTGATTVTDGRMRVNGDFSNSDFTVAVAGILGGTGDLGAVSNAGRLAPGNSIGTINTGDFDFLNGSVYEVEIDDAGNSDLLASTGAVTIDLGATVDVQGAAGTYAASTLYTIITATMGVTGTFGSVTSNLAFLDPTLIYGANDVQLRMDRNDINYSEVAEDEYQAQVADALEAIGTGNDMVDAFTGLTDEQAREALDDLSGEHVAGMLAAAASSANMLRAAIASHMVGLNHANDENMLTAALSPVNDPGTYVAAMLEPAAGALPNWDNKRVWLQMLGGFGRADARRTTPEQDRHSYGALAGVDLPLDKGGWYGFFGGYETGDVETDSQSASSDIDSYHVGAYATVPLDKGFNIAGGINATYHAITTQRYVSFGGFDEAPKGDTHGATVSAYAELSKPYKLLNAAVEPFANVSVTHSRMDGYTEKEGGSANLDVSSATSTNPATIIGVRLAKMVRMEGLALKLNATLGWQHVYGDLDSKTQMRFAVGGTSFESLGTPQERDSILFGIGLDGKISERANAYVAYTGNYSTEAEDHAIKAGVKIKF